MSTVSPLHAHKEVVGYISRRKPECRCRRRMSSPEWWVKSRECGCPREGSLGDGSEEPCDTGISLSAARFLGTELSTSVSRQATGILRERHNTSKRCFDVL